MNIPWYMRRFFEAVYAENIAIVTVAGQRFQIIPIESGVKQGCPASMYLLLLAVDPLLRWIRHHSSPAISLALACADDFLFGLKNVLTELGPLVTLLMHLEQIANLRLNFS
eukprot:4207702-Pyramimonas_sp.AAC.1